MSTAVAGAIEAPHLSLIVPVYNGADRLPSSLAELRAFLVAQPYTWELVLVDDCSNAETRRLLEEFAETMLPVHAFDGQRFGLSGAWSGPTPARIAGDREFFTRNG